MAKDRKVCFTGHRSIKNEDEIRSRLVEKIENLICDGYTQFFAGGARGFDVLAAKTILDLKIFYPQISLHLILPFRNPFEVEKGWSEEDIENYHAIVDAADDVVYMGQKYKRGLYYKRNRYLVDNAAVCVAYQRRKTGGTAYTVNYAAEQGIKLIIL